MLYHYDGSEWKTYIKFQPTASDMKKWYAERNRKTKEMRRKIDENDRKVFRNTVMQQDTEVIRKSFEKLSVSYAPVESKISLEHTTSSNIENLCEKAPTGNSIYVF